MNFGFWLKTTTDEDGAVTYNEVETFAGSSLGASVANELDAVTGSATYDGDATGVYVKNVYNSVGAKTGATSGHFTADAELTAYFGQTVNDTNTPANEAGAIAPRLLNTISGTIDSFTLNPTGGSGPEAIAWTVALDGDPSTQREYVLWHNRSHGCRWHVQRNVPWLNA